MSKSSEEFLNQLHKFNKINSQIIIQFTSFDLRLNIKKDWLILICFKNKLIRTKINENSKIQSKEYHYNQQKIKMQEKDIELLEWQSEKIQNKICFDYQNYSLDERDAVLDFQNVKIVVVFLDKYDSQFILVSLGTNIFEKASNLIGFHMKYILIIPLEVIQLQI